MKSRVRFELVGRVEVIQGLDYPVSAITTEVSNGTLAALSVEVEHDDNWALADIVEAARTALRPLCALIGVGRTLEPILGGALVTPITAERPSISAGLRELQGRYAISRRLKTLPSESLLAALRADPRLVDCSESL
jgi:hypothetical protein